MATTFRPCEPDQMLLLAPDARDWLPEGHFAHHVSDLVDGLDLTAFYAPYEGAGRRNAPYEPRMMVKVLLYGYATGVFSSRALARKLEEDVAFRVLGAGSFPSHRTLCEFRRRYLGEQGCEDAPGDASHGREAGHADGPGALRATRVAVRGAQWLGQGGPWIPAIQRAGSGQGARGMGLGVSGVERQAVATAAGGVRARLAGEIGSESSTSGVLPDASDPLACPARHCALRCPGAPAHPGSDSDPSIRLRVLSYLPTAQTPRFSMSASRAASASWERHLRPSGCADSPSPPAWARPRAHRAEEHHRDVPRRPRR